MKIFEQVIAADPRRAYATGYGPATPEAVQAERDALAALAEARAARYPEVGPEAAEPASDGMTPPAETEDVQAAVETETPPCEHPVVGGGTGVPLACDVRGHEDITAPAEPEMTP